MIISRAPLRISFVGGGTDIKEFYSHYPGKVISATIDKFVYIVVNPKVLTNEFIIKYQLTEIVSHPRELKHERFREALIDLDLAQKALEIASFADLPAKIGLGSSSCFSVALIKALFAYKGQPINKSVAAEAACRLEINILKQPIGKQDQYAAAFGGFNIFRFNPDDSVSVEPLFIDFKIRTTLEDHLLLFFTGIKRSASEVLEDQRCKIEKNFEKYKAMADSVEDFREKLMKGDIRGMAKMLDINWTKKQSLGTKISNPVLDNLYETAKNAGAWGGKILGAGGGGCLLFLALPEKHTKIAVALEEQVKKEKLTEFKKIPVKFTQSGADVLFKS